MPIYKVDGVKKDGLQKYRVVINYTNSKGEAKKKEKAAYGIAAAKDTEQRLSVEVKQASNPHNMKFSQLCYEYQQVISTEIKKSTAQNKFSNIKLHILPFFSDFYITKIAVKDIQAWKLSIEKESSAKKEPYKLNTKRDMYKELNAIFNYALRMEYLPKNPCKNVGTFKDANPQLPIIKLRYYTAEQFQTFINAAKEKAEKKNSLREWDFFLFFAIAFFTGMRRGEIEALKWSDIKDDTIYVTRSIIQKVKGGDIEGTPKTKSSIRTLQIPLPLKRILEEHKARQMSIPAFTEDFRICGGIRCLRDSSITYRNTEYAKAANLPQISVHDFRHSHASLLANEGINIQEIARRLGHSDVKVTWNTYSHLYPREEERAVRILNKINFAA